MSSPGISPSPLKKKGPTSHQMVFARKTNLQLNLDVIEMDNQATPQKSNKTPASAINKDGKAVENPFLQSVDGAR